MFLRMYVTSVECTLMTLEATNVIAMRLQVIAKGDVQSRRESELMIAEKLEAFARAGNDMAAGVSNSVIRNNFRAVIRANEKRLTALRKAA